MKNEMPAGRKLREVKKARSARGLRAGTAVYTADCRNRDGKRHRYAHICPAYFPLLKKLRGGSSGGSGITGVC